MIQIKSFVLEKKVKLQCDIYIPISIEFVKNDLNISEIKYIRIGDDKNMLEIGIEEDCTIKSLTLIMCKNVENNLKEEYENLLELKTGCPVFDFAFKGEKKYYDINAMLNTVISQESIYLNFSKKRVDKGLRNGNIIFFMSKDDELVGVKVDNLVTKDMDIIKEAFM